MLFVIRTNCGCQRVFELPDLHLEHPLRLPLQKTNRHGFQPIYGHRTFKFMGEYTNDREPILEESETWWDAIT